jgi:hypothetical protein
MRTKFFPALALSLILLAAVFSACSKTAAVWYVRPELEHDWARVINGAPKPVMKVQAWEDSELPPGPGIYIATNPWQSAEKASVYYRLSYDLEYQGAHILALDPWMIFRKFKNPGLPPGRVYSDAGGDGALLIPGRDPQAVDAWVARLIQESPGKFPSDEKLWQDWGKRLFNGSRFPHGARTYNWQDVFFRLMGNEQVWVYAPLSSIRRYRNSQKAILEATAFPERTGTNEYSLQARLLWALPLGSEKEKEKLKTVVAWLKKPETQTLIADTLEWIPADPYGKPYDPMSLASHRNWLTASFIYEVNR